MSPDAVPGAAPYPKNLNLQIHGLRGFSALGVFVCHIYGMSKIWHFWPSELAPFNRFFQAGAYGVEIFFIISGYLITASLIRHQSAKKFLIDRCIRIYPVFLAIHVLVFALGPIAKYKWMAGISAAHWAEAFVSNALFLPGIFNLPIAQLNAWSLSYEAAFYLLSASMFVAATVAGRKLANFGLILVLVPILLIYPIASFFLVGVAIFFITGRQVIRFPSSLRWLSIPGLFAVLTLLTLADCRRAFIFSALIPAFVFFWSIVDGKCGLSAILRSGWLQYLGTISYSFYLWSPVVTYPMKIIMGKIFQGRISDLSMLILFALSASVGAVIVAHLSYLYFEDRLGRTLRRRAYRQESTQIDRPKPLVSMKAGIS
jgi:peptidoglycan/LPS O-acetylase OafA/YrhL